MCEHITVAQPETLNTDLHNFGIVYIFVFSTMMSEKCVLNVILELRSKSRSPDCFRGYLRLNLWVQLTL